MGRSINYGCEDEPPELMEVCSSLGQGHSGAASPWPRPAYGTPQAAPGAASKLSTALAWPRRARAWDLPAPAENLRTQLRRSGEERKALVSVVLEFGGEGKENFAAAAA